MSSNPGWSSNKINALHERLGFELGLFWTFYVLARWLHPQNAEYLVFKVEGDETDALITAARFTAGTLRVDTDTKGRLWGRVVDGTPNTINIYNDSARSVLVATGTAADGATATLTPQTGYTLAGTMTLGTIGANLTFVLLLVPPPYDRAGVEFDGDEEEDGQSTDSFRKRIEKIQALCLQAAAEASGGSAELMKTLFRRNLVSISAKDLILDPGLKLATGNSGAVQEEPRGLLEDWRLGSESNTTIVKAGGPTQSPAVAYASGGWEGKATGPTLGTRGRPGVTTLNCVKTLTETAPEFEAVNEPDDSRFKPDQGRASIPGKLRLRMGAQWKDPALGIESFLLDYKPTITNSTGTSLSTTTTDWSVVGLKASLSAAGILYTYYDGPSTTLEFYKSSAGRDARTSSELVTQKTSPGSSAVFTTEDLGNGLVVTGKTNGAPANGDKGTVNFNIPQATQPAARLTITISETVAPSTWLNAINAGGVGGLSWEPHVASSPNLDAGWIEAGMLVPFLKLLGKI